MRLLTFTTVCAAYKTGRSSESVAALSVRTGLTWSPAEKAYEMVSVVAVVSLCSVIVAPMIDSPLLLEMLPLTS